MANLTGLGKMFAEEDRPMIRALAIAMGVASIRLYILVFTAGFGMGFEEVFGASFWLGLGTNLLIAEVWISRGSEHIIR